MDRFTGKVALVTGAASGIGLATARLLARDGATVFGGDIGAIPPTPEPIEPLHLDVTTDDSFAAAVDAIVARHGRLDILFNNAGAPGTQLTAADMEMAEWDATMSLLLRSVALGIRLAVPAMIKGGRGAIVNTASVASFEAGRGPLAYSVAKAAVLQLTKVSAAQLARHAIRVNAVCPGLILTNIFSNGVRTRLGQPAIADEIDDYMARVAPYSQPLHQQGLPEDIAEAVAYLASDAARFVTGTHLLVDGGLLTGTRNSWDPDFQLPDDHPMRKLWAATEAPTT